MYFRSMAYKKLKYWFDQELALQLAQKIRHAAPDFDDDTFAAAIAGKIDPLELKDRVEVFADALYHGFNGNYPEGLEVLLQILGPENPKETGMFTEFYWLMPIAKYTEKYGLDDFAASMRAIEAITRRNTGEYAIRPFLLHHPERTMAQMLQWSTDASFHVRRLACEGLRPRLPWAKKLDMFSADPSPIIPILDNLKDDPSKYVQKSVANCLNDILKDNPAIGQSIVERWRDGAPGKARRWIIRHALRNLVKAKDPWARCIIASIENHDSR